MRTPSRGEDSVSPGFESVPGRDGQTDRITIANTRSQQYLPLQLSRVKGNGGKQAEWSLCLSVRSIPVKLQKKSTV